MPVVWRDLWCATVQVMNWYNFLLLLGVYILPFYEKTYCHICLRIGI